MSLLDAGLNNRYMSQQCKQDERQPEDTKPESREHLVIGAGKMGRNYVARLIDLGIAEQDISVVDIDPEKLQTLQSEFPGISVGSSLPNEAPENAYVISSTPAHLKNLEDLSSYTMPPKVLVEKPLITTSQLERLSEKVSKIIDAYSDGFTAYVIDFSPAMTSLMRFMHDNSLSVSDGSGVWTKNRHGDSRPTAGDLEDEMTHQLAAMLALSSVNHSLTTGHVSAHLTYEDFVDRDAQNNLASLDESIPLRPNATTTMTLHLNTEERPEPFEIRLFSSFIAENQERRIEVLLSDHTGLPQYRATVEFDNPVINGDKLTISNLIDGKEEEKIFKKPDKVRLQIEAFLKATTIGEKHPFLKTMNDGLQMVELARSAEKSHQEECTFIEVDLRNGTSSVI